MFKIFFALVAVTTMVSMGFIGKMGKVGMIPTEQVQPAPVMIGTDGALTFPGRIPGPDTVYSLRRAIKMEDVEKLNAILFENHLFVAPSN